MDLEGYKYVWLIVTFIIRFFAIRLGVGIWASRKVSDAADYIVAGRKLPIYMVGASVMATWFAAETLMGASSMGYQYGFQGLALEARDRRSSLPRALVARIQQGVEDALPGRVEAAVGFHPRPGDPVDAFVFVGTRYAARTTIEMIDALRSQGFDDLGVLDFAIAVADANQWARTHRVLGLDPCLFYLDEVRPERVDAIET